MCCKEFAICFNVSDMLETTRCSSRAAWRMEEWDTSEKVDCDLTVTPMDRAQRRVFLNRAEDELARRSRRDLRKLKMEVRDTAIAKVVEAILEWKRKSDPEASLEDVVSDAVDHFAQYHEMILNEKTVWRA